MTGTLWLAAGGLAVGLVLLGFAAGRFVGGSAALARNLGIPPLIVGLLIVGFGTSAPEMLVSANAALAGRPGLAIGNAVGSNIANIALVLGVAALARPLDVHSRVLRRELPIPLAAMLFALILIEDGTLGRLDGLTLLAAFAFLGYWMVAIALRRREEVDPLAAEYAAEMPSPMATRRAVLWLVVGLLLMLGASRVLVWSAVQIAEALGFSNLVIGLTVVAVGTSLPELAAAVAAARKNEHDIAIGNVLGSNTFNTLAVMGIAGAIRPGPFLPEVLTRDFPVMIALTLALFAMAYGFKGMGRINRLEGALLVACFIAYVSVLLGGTG